MKQPTPLSLSQYVAKAAEWPFLTSHLCFLSNSAHYEKLFREGMCPAKRLSPVTQPPFQLHRASEMQTEDLYMEHSESFLRRGRVAGIVSACSVNVIAEAAPATM